MIRISTGMQRRWASTISLCAAGMLLSGCSLFPSADARRGDQHLAAGNWEEAGQAYKQALKEDPFDASLQTKYALSQERAAAMYEERGRAALKDRQIDLAIEQFKRALTVEPTSAEHQSSLSDAIRLKESRSQYREAERLAQLGLSRRTDRQSQHEAEEGAVSGLDDPYVLSLDGQGERYVGVAEGHAGFEASACERATERHHYPRPTGKVRAGGEDHSFQ